MKLPALATAFAALTLCACVTQEDQLVKSVPVGSGTSKLTVLPFIACVKAKWAASGRRIGSYSPDPDGQILVVKGPNGTDTVLLQAEPSALGAGYTIYGDIAAASRFVADAHTCD
jgi:hypothetical protein